jgi:glycosyltransferase involved in cell wall biosynthesis
MLDPWSMAQKSFKKRIALTLGTRRFLREAAAIHLLHSEEGDYLRDLGIDTRGFVIANGVTLSEIDREPIETEYRDPYILFLGRLHHKKGLDYLAEAFVRISSEFPDIHLVVAGPDDGASESFQSFIRDQRLESRVHITGPIYGERKWAVLTGAKLFCLPSRQEGFSVAILEALACRTPVVISDQCHFPEVASANAGRVVPLDPERIAAAFREILTDENIRIAMGDNARKLIEDHYTWDRIVRQTIVMYQECLLERQKLS